jgi:hypothetical protein
LQRYDIKKAGPCLPVIRGSGFCGNRLKKENRLIWLILATLPPILSKFAGLKTSKKRK